jgi:hypothetical protein
MNEPGIEQESGAAANQTIIFQLAGDCVAATTSRKDNVLIGRAADRGRPQQKDPIPNCRYYQE